MSDQLILQESSSVTESLPAFFVSAVQPMQFSGRAFLESSSHQEWTDSMMQYVKFSFPEFADDKDVNKASYVRSEKGQAAEDLKTAGEL